MTADSTTRAYGAANPTGLGFEISGFQNNETVSVVTGAPELSVAASADALAAAGSKHAIVVAQGTLAAANYTFAFVNGNLDITKRPIEITADAKSKVYGAADPALTYRITAGSLVGQDVLTGSLSRAAGEAVGQYEIGLGTLTAGDNYSVALVPAKLTITAWNLKGFYAPIGEANSFVLAPKATAPTASSSTVWQTAKGGSAIPLKFDIFKGDPTTTPESTQTADVKGFAAVKLSGCAGSIDDLVEETVAGAGSSSLTYSDGQFIQVWKTGTVSKDTCYRVVMTTQDDSTIQTFVKLRK